MLEQVTLRSLLFVVVFFFFFIAGSSCIFVVIGFGNLLCVVNVSTTTDMHPDGEVDTFDSDVGGFGEDSGSLRPLFVFFCAVWGILNDVSSCIFVVIRSGDLLLLLFLFLLLLLCVDTISETDGKQSDSDVDSFVIGGVCDWCC